MDAKVRREAKAADLKQRCIVRMKYTETGLLINAVAAVMDAISRHGAVVIGGVVVRAVTAHVAVAVGAVRRAWFDVVVSGVGSKPGEHG